MIRLKGYDYSSPGAYFITICTHQRQCLFGEIVDGEMQFSEFGLIVFNEWVRSHDIRQEVNFDAWVIMPNHIHAIVLIQTSDLPQHPVGAHGRAPTQWCVPTQWCAPTLWNCVPQTPFSFIIRCGS